MATKLADELRGLLERVLRTSSASDATGPLRAPPGARLALLEAVSEAARAGLDLGTEPREAAAEGAGAAPLHRTAATGAPAAAGATGAPPPFALDTVGGLKPPAAAAATGGGLVRAPSQQQPRLSKPLLRQLVVAAARARAAEGEEEGGSSSISSYTNPASFLSPGSAARSLAPLGSGGLDALSLWDRYKAAAQRAELASAAVVEKDAALSALQQRCAELHAALSQVGKGSSRSAVGVVRWEARFTCWHDRAH